MKILILTNKVPYPANDGSSIAMAAMVDGFLKNGAVVSLLSLNTRKHYKSPEATAEVLPSKLEFHKVDVNTNINPLGAALNLLTGEAYHVSRFYQNAFAQKLVELLKEQTFDVIQLEGLSMAVYLDLIRKHTKAPVSLRAHNIEYKIWERHIANEMDFFHRTYLRIQVNRLRKFELQAIKQVDAIVAITQEDESVMKEFLPGSKTISIPCGIAVNEVTVCETEEYKSDIGYLASFDWMPNVQGLEWFLGKVWPVLKKGRPKTTFRTGGRHMPADIKNLREPGISVYPDVPDMRQFVCGSRILVIPLLAGSGMRIKVIENMALGKCQVSTSVGAEGVMVENGRDILLADAPEEFAQQIILALDSEELRRNIEVQARKTIEAHYNNKDLGSRLLTFYKEQVC